MYIISKFKTLTMLLLFMVIANVVFAQPGQNTVVIQGVYTPTIGEASKLNTSPTLTDTVYKTPVFKYSIMEKKLNTPFKVAPIKPAKLLGEPLNKLYSNYVALGMGNYTTPYFEFYHSKLRSRSTKYGVHLKHMSSAGKINDYAFPGWSDNQVEIYGSKFWKKSVLDASIDYQRNVVHAYGFEPNNYSAIDQPKDVDYVQRYNFVKAKLNWYRYRLRKSEMNYNIKTNYYYLQDFYRNSEHNSSTTARFDWSTNIVKKAKLARIGFDIDNELYNNSDGTLSNTKNLLSITPFYKFNYGVLTAFIGAKAQVKTDISTTMSLYPKIKLNLAAIPDVLYFNLNLTGGNYYNSMKSLTDKNPYILSSLNSEFTNQQVQVNFGIGSSISKSVNFDIQLYYDKFENAALFVNDTNITYYNGFNVIYDDYDRVKLQVDIAYQKHERLKFLLRGNYYVYNMKEQQHPWHKPSFDAHLSANYNIKDKIILKAEVVTYGSSYALVYTDNASEAVKIDAWADLNIGIEYRYRKKLGIFANLNNLTAGRYQRWYNYPSYKFNFMAGVNYIF